MWRWFRSRMMRRRARKRTQPTRLRRSAVFAWMPDGSVRDVSATPGRGYYALPCVHPEGRSVVFHGGTSEYSRIWSTDLDTGTSTPLTSDTKVACSAAYSADGEYITFCADDVARHRPYTMEKAVHAFPGIGIYFGGLPYWKNIFVMKADGTDVRRVTSGPYSDFRPTFSPDGKYIVFLRRRGLPKAKPTLWRVALNGRDTPQALITDVSVGRPWCSTDGASIYFFTNVNGRNSLAVMPSSGGAWKPLANDTLGAWSHGPYCDPDGIHLWYHCGVDGSSICKLPLDGGDPVIQEPPGFSRQICAHPSISRNNVVAFDWMELDPVRGDGG